MPAMAKNVIWATVFSVIAGILQSTLLSRLAANSVGPDIALGILVFTAYRNGAMTGQLSGFCSGIFLDFLSAAPLGLNAFVRTLIGAVAGRMDGALFLDNLFLPMVLCAGATALKAALYFILHLLFQGTVPSYAPLEGTLWIELALNTAIAPALFGLLKLFDTLLAGKRER
jgi:rod shape-determining protein MreD